MAKLKAPKDVSSFSFDGEVYEVKRGRVDVPDQAVEVALAHGFTEIGEKADEQPEQPAEQPEQQPEQPQE